jgi:stage V sporulation protein R
MTEPLLITSRCDWTPELIARVYREIETIAYEELDLKGKVYPNQLEIITTEQMMDAYASIGLPVHYNHWSFGKDFLKTAKGYESGRTGLAYEIVINSKPCISYLMEDNNMMMQALVIAHAAFGHNAVFKNNETFKQWTNAGNIVDYMIFARDYIRQCEERYGPEEVEQLLDAAHALAPHGIDKYKRKHRPKLSDEARLKKLIERDEQRQRELDIIMQKTSFRDPELDDEIEHDEQEENLLYYLMKNSPILEQWQREVLRIVHKINQYFYPQTQTQVLNEGYASFVHYYIMTRLEEKGILSADAFIAFLQSHSGVIYQPPYNSRRYSGGLNPYYLGFNILMDVKRMIEAPTDEDREWFPHLMGRRWQEVVQEACFEHRDDSFIMQYLSPNVIRKLGLFSVKIDRNDDGDPQAFVSEIHDDVGYKQLRINLARSRERINGVPVIKVIGADMEGDRTLSLAYVPYKGRELDRDSATQVADYIDYLWGYPVELDDGTEE